MPNITDVNEFTDPIDFPADGEAATSASILQFLQDVANRTRNLLNRLVLIEGSTTAVPLLVAPSSGVAPGGGWAYDASTGSWTCSTNGASLFFPLNDMLRNGAVITSARARVNPGGTSATGTGTMDVSVVHNEYDTDLSLLASTVVGIDEAADSDGSIQVLDADLSSHVVNKTLRRDYFLRVRGASTAGATPDALFGTEITVANPTSP